MDHAGATVFMPNDKTIRGGSGLYFLELRQAHGAASTIKVPRK